MGCTRVSDEQRFPPNPEKLTILTTVPPQKATGVSPDVQVDLCLSSLVDPRTVADADATLSSGSQRFDSDLSVQLVPWRGPGGDPLPSDAESPWCSGSVLSVTPGASLQGGVFYRVGLLPSVGGWAGESLDTDAVGWTRTEDDEMRYILEFTVGTPEGDTDGTTTGTSPADPEPEPPPVPSMSDLFAPGEPFDPKRRACSCHTGADALAHARLDLSTPEAAFDALVLPTELHDTGFPLVTPRRPSESFLLHKLLRDADGAAIHGVLGDPMPPDEPLPYPDIVRIARWIEGGAEP